jgi:AcrR family transcriptional regulator
MVSGTKEPGRQTRLRIQHALRRLSLSGPYEAITVEAICREAQVGRSTFYGHYAGKDAVKAAAVAVHLSLDIEAALRGASGLPSIFQALFRHADQHRVSYEALRSGRGKDVVLAAIGKVLTEAIGRETGSATVRTDQTRKRAAVAFAVAGAVALLVEWLDHMPDGDPNTRAALVSEMVGRTLFQI